MSRIAIDGFCPACGRRSLAVDVSVLRGPTAQVRCFFPDCPQPYAASVLLADSETEHLVELQDDDQWTLKHPLRERINGDLFSCDMHQYLSTDLDNGNGPQTPGRYRVFYVGHDPVSTTLHAQILAWQPVSSP